MNLILHVKVLKKGISVRNKEALLKYFQFCNSNRGSLQ